MPCDPMMVDHSQLTSPVAMTFGDHITVQCLHTDGYTTPAGDNNFTVSCLLDGYRTYLDNVQECISKDLVVYFGVKFPIIHLSTVKNGYETFLKE